MSVWLDGARKCVIVTSARRALPVRSAHCLTGLPWARLSLQPTRLLLFPAQCYVLLSKYVKGGEKKSVCTSVCQSGYFTFGLWAVFSSSLSISQLLKVQHITVVLCWIYIMVTVFAWLFWTHRARTNTSAVMVVMMPSLTTRSHFCAIFLNLFCKQKTRMVI